MRSIRTVLVIGAVSTLALQSATARAIPIPDSSTANCANNPCLRITDTSTIDSSFTAAVQGSSQHGVGISGDGGWAGVLGSSEVNTGTGVVGDGYGDSNGVLGQAYGGGSGIYGTSQSGLAGQFYGASGIFTYESSSGSGNYALMAEADYQGTYAGYSLATLPTLAISSTRPMRG